MRRIMLFVLAMAVTGCVTSTAPPRASAPACSITPELAGTWQTWRFSQLGPAWTALRLNCDCSYSSSIQLLWMRISEEGTFDISGDRIVFHRPARTIETPYVLDDDRLTLRETASTETIYRRTGEERCRPSE